VVKAPGGSVVVVDSRSGTATIDYPDQGCYSVRVSAGTSSSNQSAPVEMKLRFDNGGGSEGTATIGGADHCR
jgi:hypothetical protein